MEKLVTMTELVWDSVEEHQVNDVSVDVCFNTICKYAKLLQTPLSLSMFIPCNEKGEPMEEPMDYVDFLVLLKEDKIGIYEKAWYRECQEYRKALDKVLFEGWEKGSGQVEINEEGFYLKYNSNDRQAFWSIDNQEFELAQGGAYNTIETLEDLIISGIELTPTEACKKQIGL